MDVKNEISEELRSLSAVVATISRENPYGVPDGYFSDLATMILLKTGGLNSPKSLIFSVPEGYFEGFAQHVLGRIKAGAGSGGVIPEPEELPAILAQAARVTPYQVPEGFFEELSPVLAVLREKNPYTVPAGYFESLAARPVVARPMVAVAGEASERVAARAGHESAAEFAIEPAVEPAVGFAIEPAAESTARVVSLGKRRSWWKYSAAAVVAGLILAIGWLRTQTTSSVAGVHSTKPGVVQPAAAQFAQNLSKVSDEDLQNFLVDQDTTLAQPVQNNASMAALDMNDSDLKTLLGDVPDGELKQYMEEHGGALDIATN